MPIFSYKATNKKGRVKRGQAVGMGEADVFSRLQRLELANIQLKDITEELSTKILLFINPIKAKDLAIFSRQFSVLISAQVPLVESLIILIEQTKNITFQKVLSEITYEVNSGNFLSDSLAKRPKIFSALFVNIIRSGETSGRLDEVLNYLADEIEKNYDMVSKIKGAMIYPVFILSGLFLVGIVLMVYVIPNLTSVLTESGADLPLATRIIIAVSDFLQDYLLLVIIFLIALAVAFRYFSKTSYGRLAIDTFKINMPIFGKLFKQIYIIRFTRALSTLTKGGVSITKSLTIVNKIINNVVYQKIISDTLEAVKDGAPISLVMERSKDIPQMVPQMINVGERTGKLEVVLDKITDFYGREVTNSLGNLSAIMEPAIMVIMGAGVGIMVAAVLMPMYNLASQF